MALSYSFKELQALPRLLNPSASRGSCLSLVSSRANQDIGGLAAFAREEAEANPKAMRVIRNDLIKHLSFCDLDDSSLPPSRHLIGRQWFNPNIIEIHGSQAGE